MKYTIDIQQDKKIGIFSDLHVGVSNDSKMRLDETQKCVKWIIQEFKKNEVDWVIFCGDLFNSRYSINVNTLNVGIDIVEALAFNFEKIFLIAGNHDIYYKNTNNINSITFLKDLSRNDNIYVIDKEPLFLNVNGTTFGLYPWGVDIEGIKKIEDFTAPTYGFGHFEFNGAENLGQTMTGAKYSLANLFALGDTLFSGHYHKNKTYTDLKSGKYLYMVGSPLQLNWADYNLNKKIVILDTDSQKFIELNNNINARFEKIYYTGFKDGKYSDEALKKLCRKNFVKFEIDCKYKFDEIVKCNDIIKEMNPYSFEIEYLISLDSDSDEMTEMNINLKQKNNQDYLLEYLDNIFPEYSEINESLDLKYLKELALSYFEKTQVSDADKKEAEA